MLREKCIGYSVRIVPGHEIVGKPSAIILYHPTLGELLEESRIIAAKCPEAVLAAVVEPFRRLLVEAAFPDAVVMDDSETIQPSLIFSSRKRKEIRFTEKEKRTLSELPYGLSAKELSQRLGISERSVRRMKERLMRKTGLVSSEQLLVYALLSGEISTRSS